MSGRVVLVTGAGRGIGLAMARALAAKGASIAIQDVVEQIAIHACADMRKDFAVRTAAFSGDIGDLPLTTCLVERTREALGGFHVLINNASIQSQHNWLDTSAEVIERELRANLVAPVLLCQSAARVFMPQRWGRIINVGSIQQRAGNPGMLSYSLSKAALEKLTFALSRELASHQITVNTIAPGWFNTERNRHDLATPQIVTERGRQVPIGRLGEPEDCAGAALLLCSDAGSYITGQTLYVAGGY